MAEREAERMERLDRYWDAAVIGTLSGTPAGHDPGVDSSGISSGIDRADTEVIRMVHDRATAAPAADAAFAARLWDDLVAAAAPALAAASTGLPGSAAGHANRTHWRRRARTRLACLASVGVLIVGSVLSVLHAQGPTPVSAQIILQRAATALAAPTGRVLHEIEVVTGMTTRTTESWIQLDNGGRLVRSASSWAYNTHDRAWAVRTRQTSQYYDAVQNRVLITKQPPSPCDGPPFQQPWIDQYRQLILSEQRLTPHSVRRQMLDGHDVYVLGSTSPKTLTPGLNVVWYIDTRSYLPRGIDEIHLSAQGRITYSGPRKRNTKGGTFKVGDDKKWDNNIRPPTKPASYRNYSGRRRPWDRSLRRAGYIRTNWGAGKQSPSRACRACLTGATRQSISKPRTSSKSRISTPKSGA